MNSYIGIVVIDIIFIFVICIVNYKLLKKATECSLKTIIKNVIVPLLIPTVITMLVIMLWGMLENAPKQVIVK